MCPDQYLQTPTSEALSSRTLKRYNVIITKSKEYFMHEVFWRIVSQQRPFVIEDECMIDKQYHAQYDHKSPAKTSCMAAKGCRKAAAWSHGARTCTRPAMTADRLEAQRKDHVEIDELRQY